MFLFFNALVASMDGLIIGINLKLSKIKLSKLNGFIMFITNCLIYTFVLLLYKYFHFTFMTKNISTILYLLLAYMAFKENENEKTSKN